MMRLNRRNTLKYGLATGTAFSIIPSHAFGANERVNVALVGAAGVMEWIIKDFENNPHAQLVAFSDVHHTAKLKEITKDYPDVPLYVDFRVMLDKHPEIDAVMISTPDHTHHYIGAYCMKAGKHVYVQKPLAHNIAEVRDLARLEKETGLVCQMGNQGHSGLGIVLLDKWIKGGHLGDIKEVHAWNLLSRSVPDKQPDTAPIPANLDWDKWVGPAEMVDYSAAYVPNRWRSWFKFGTGTLGDWFCHNADAPYTILGLDCPKLVEVESTGKKELSFPDSSKVTYTFKLPGTDRDLKLHWTSGTKFLPPRPEGMETDKRFEDSWGGTMLIGSKATALTASHAKPPRIIPESLHQEMAKDLPRVSAKRSNHTDNWLLAIKGEEKVRSDFAYASRLTETMHWGNIALHVGRNLKIDPVKRTIIGDEEATKLMSWPAPRDGWKI